VIAHINAIVIHGCRFGPTAYVVSASDLHTVDPENRIAKYADDTYLIIGSSKRETVRMELDHIAAWAAQNNLRLNTNKSREMIITRKLKTDSNSIPPKMKMECVTSMVILGVTISDNLGATKHVDGVITSRSRSLYALRVLRAHGLQDEALHVVTRAIMMARLLYVAPAWWGLSSAKDQLKLERFQKRGEDGVYSNRCPPVGALVSSVEDTIILNPNHVLNGLMLATVTRSYNLRPHLHSCILTEKDELNFISSTTKIKKALPKRAPPNQNTLNYY